MFSCSDVVNYGSGEWADGKFGLYCSRDFSALVSGLLLRLSTHLSFSLSMSGSLEAVVIFCSNNFSYFFFTCWLW